MQKTVIFEGLGLSAHEYAGLPVGSIRKTRQDMIERGTAPSSLLRDVTYKQAEVKESASPMNDVVVVNGISCPAASPSCEKRPCRALQKDLRQGFQTAEKVKIDVPHLWRRWTLVKKIMNSI